MQTISIRWFWWEFSFCRRTVRRTECIQLEKLYTLFGINDFCKRISIRLSYASWICKNTVDWNDKQRIVTLSYIHADQIKCLPYIKWVTYHLWLYLCNIVWYSISSFFAKILLRKRYVFHISTYTIYLSTKRLHWKC